MNKGLKEQLKREIKDKLEQVQNKQLDLEEQCHKIRYAQELNSKQLEDFEKLKVKKKKLDKELFSKAPAKEE